MAKYMTEFIGTFFLVFTIGLTVTQGIAMAPLAIGCALMIMVYMGGHVSGGHYNPAVSLAALLRGALNTADLVPYWVAQVAGSIAAAIVVSVIFGTGAVNADGDTESAQVIVKQQTQDVLVSTHASLTRNDEQAMPVSGFFGPAPGEGFSISHPGPWIVEILFSFALCIVVLNVATSEATSGNSYFGLAIGFTIVVGAFAGGPISGGAFNPAVGLGPNLIKGTMGGDPAAMGNIILHTLGPFVGGILAAIVFKMQEAHVVKQKET